MNKQNENTTTTTTTITKDLEECKVCHALSGSIISGAGIYSLLLRNRHPENRVWLSVLILKSIYENQSNSNFINEHGHIHFY
ncbi:hypothetical protein PPL_00104 [Heterostelium album PN500]|uniref:Uncharacterized protein n=1 Tax=Heterostelium pallidum (strain ATCC 26659 / Pp 5 / PN500) TaxID=670386 RepID=D3AVJ1_HETP5|nr:hypothetical protein PPL_00104 [Heterostelium album PN500]EFA86314.1 hypothetical protein PPL_00104 [Heterostelium album PN500]|eukprot:XP_020438419.1 hypothetical protein PPL_00104 [Heterostelium album PN500]